jgi:hypothetical protein
MAKSFQVYAGDGHRPASRQEDVDCRVGPSRPDRSSTAPPTNPHCCSGFAPDCRPGRWWTGRRTPGRPRGRGGSEGPRDDEWKPCTLLVGPEVTPHSLRYFFGPTGKSQDLSWSPGFWLRRDRVGMDGSPSHERGGLPAPLPDKSQPLLPLTLFQTLFDQLNLDV